MAVSGFTVIDADGHVFETNRLYDLFTERYMAPQYAAAFKALLAKARAAWRRGGEVPTVNIWAVEGRERVLGWSRPMGPSTATAIDFRGGGLKPGTEAAKAPLDPIGRLRDMDREGIDISVIYPSSLASFCALGDTGLEASIYEAYNRWLADYCNADSRRLKYVAVVSLRDIGKAVAEIERTAKDNVVVGVYCQTHMGERQLDQPHFYPIWEAALKHNLPIAVHHASAGLPPFGVGVFEMNENWFLQHASSNPFEQMRAICTMIGGGIFEKFPKLQVAYLEAGCGWLPYWLDRLDEHFALMPNSVPLLKHKPGVVFTKGGCYISFEPGERMLPYTIKHVGDDRIVFASDYPHFDGKFPDSVRAVTERKDIPESSKRKLLGENARRLYPRLG